MNTNAEGPEEPGRSYWQPHPWLATTVRIAVTTVPVVASVALGFAIEQLVGEPTGLGKVAWWTGLLGSCVLVCVCLERLGRTALPLVTLLKIGMLFPGAAPGRLAVARTAARTAGIARVLDESSSPPAGDGPELAAERAVALVASLSLHDRKTQGHAERVRTLAGMIGDELGLPGTELERLRWAALLHDLGKLAVDASILDKRGALSDAEMQAVRRHPSEGERLTAHLDEWLGPWSRAISDHHERYDGAGYPNGRAGEGISLGGRIITVADAYDVMTSAHSYKSPVTPEAARMELARCAGSQFDPAVVRAFLAIPEQRLRGLRPAFLPGALSFGPSRTTTATLGKVAAALVSCLSVVGLTSLRPEGTGTATRSGIVAMPLGLPADATIGSTLANQATDSHGARPESYRDGRSVGRSSDGGTRSEDRHTSGTGKAAGVAPTSDTIPYSSTTSSTSYRVGPGTTVPPTSTTEGSPSRTTVPSTSTTAPPPPTTVPPPSPPSDLTATPGCETLGFLPPASVTLTWRKSATRGATYDVMQREGSGYTYVARDLPSGTTTYTVQDLDPGSQYTFEVWAVNGAGQSASTAPKSVTPECL